jgi:AraC-like DNA-binding protein
MHAYGTVAAGLVDTLCTLGERQYGVPRSELLYVGALEVKELRDAGAQVPAVALLEMVTYLLERSQDRALGIRYAEATDLRTQGFWGYLFLSSLTLRRAADLLVRFQRVRHGSRMSFRIEGEWAVFERESDANLPVALRPIVGDAFLASFCVHRRRWMPASERGPMEAWLDYPEEPHHRELRALVGGPITFNAPFIRHHVSARELDVKSTVADPHLMQLAEMQLERQLAQVLERVPAQDLVVRVRSLLVARLQQGTSIDQVAHSLRFSVRTLRRRLEERGLSFQRLVEEVRFGRAVEYLTQTEDAIERVSERLGYGDPSNFRRAFRRWAGSSPKAYRARHVRGALGQK